MTSAFLRALCLVVLVPVAASAEPPTGFAAYEEAWKYDCNAPFEHFEPAEVKEHLGFVYRHTGATVQVRRLQGKATGKLGLLAGIKDLDDDTKATVLAFLKRFEAEDVDAIVIGGDTAEEPEVLDRVYALLVASTGRPLFTIAGNSERAAAHNYAVGKQRAAGHLHLLNGNQVRRFDGEGFDLVTLAGYHDRRYLHLAGGCIYKDGDLNAVADAVRASDDPVVFLSHGGPRQRGQKALDYVPGADNVGDERLTELITRAKIPFGIFGHILEAGARGTDLKGTPLPQKKLHKALFVNQGSANPLPWKLNDGTTSYGLAAIWSIKGKGASYEVLRAPKPEPKAAP